MNAVTSKAARITASPSEGEADRLTAAIRSKHDDSAPVWRRRLLTLD
jgi:hypothetical protein